MEDSDYKFNYDKKKGLKKIYYFLLYNFVILLLFYSLNSSLKNSDFSHLNLSEDLKQKNYSIMYYTINVHTTVAMGDIVPVSRVARFIFAVHLLFSFVGNAYILLVL